MNNITHTTLSGASIVTTSNLITKFQLIPVGHFDIGGVRLPVYKNMSKFNLYMAKLLLGWTYIPSTACTSTQSHTVSSGEPPQYTESQLLLG